VTAQLLAPDLIETMREAASDKDFWATVDLQALVRRRVLKQQSMMT
jgi:hypothetical protein